MARMIAILFAVVVAFGGSAAAQSGKPAAKPAPAADQKPKPPAEKGKKVTGTACVRAGVEAGCVMLATTDGKSVYNALGPKRPNVGDVVRFSGTTKPGTPTICMQGTPIELASFTAVKMKCPLPEKK
jgi:hypothetical protein